MVTIYDTYMYWRRGWERQSVHFGISSTWLTSFGFWGQSKSDKHLMVLHSNIYQYHIIINGDKHLMVLHSNISDCHIYPCLILSLPLGDFSLLKKRKLNCYLLSKWMVTKIGTNASPVYIRLYDVISYDKFQGSRLRSHGP